MTSSNKNIDVILSEQQKNRNAMKHIRKENYGDRKVERLNPKTHYAEITKEIVHNVLVLHAIPALAKKGYMSIERLSLESGVSKASLFYKLRILEADGLITSRRAPGTRKLVEYAATEEGVSYYNALTQVLSNKEKLGKLSRR